MPHKVRRRLIFNEAAAPSEAHNKILFFALSTENTFFLSLMLRISLKGSCQARHNGPAELRRGDDFHRCTVAHDFHREFGGVRVGHLHLVIAVDPLRNLLAVPGLFGNPARLLGRKRSTAQAVA